MYRRMWVKPSGEQLKARLKQQIKHRAHRTRHKNGKQQGAQRGRGGLLLLYHLGIGGVFLEGFDRDI